MKFNCEKALLQNGLTTAARAAAAKSPQHALECLLLETEENGISVTGFDMKTGIRTVVPADVVEPDRILLNTKLITDIVRKMPDGILSFETDRNLLTRLTCRDTHYEIPGESAEDYPELPALDEENSFRIQEKKLKAMIDNTIFAVAVSDIRPVQTGEKFEIENGMLTVAAVDGYRIAVCRDTLEDSDGKEQCSFVVPSGMLNEVSRIAGDSEEPAVIHLGRSHILFSVGDTEIISRKLEGEFLNFHSHIKAESRYGVKVSRRALLESFDRVSLIIDEKNKSAVRCRFGEGSVALSCVTGLGRFKDVCPIEGMTEKLEIGFNNRYMQDALRAAPADELLLNLTNSSSPCMIRAADGSDGFLYLILPVRLPVGDD